MTEFQDLPQDGQIRRYLDLAAEARKHSQSPYSGLFTVTPPDPWTTLIKQLAIMYAIIGVLLFVVALASGIQALFGNLNGTIARAA
jgi:hypothetical protein